MSGNEFTPWIFLKKISSVCKKLKWIFVIKWNSSRQTDINQDKRKKMWKFRHRSEKSYRKFLFLFFIRFVFHLKPPFLTHCACRHQSELEKIIRISRRKEKKKSVKRKFHGQSRTEIDKFSPSRTILILINTEVEKRWEELFIVWHLIEKVFRPR